MKLKKSSIDFFLNGDYFCINICKIIYVYKGVGFYFRYRKCLDYICILVVVDCMGRMYILNDKILYIFYDYLNGLNNLF